MVFSLAWDSGETDCYLAIALSFRQASAIVGPVPSWQLQSQSSGSGRTHPTIVLSSVLRYLRLCVTTGFGQIVVEQAYGCTDLSA